ncbi:MAG: hypothetical protein C0465_17930 [Ralstonia sp.]|uniref:zinc ribbon domain-containing protein n=1 Tax=Ralstonia sp. TaxID=54061 RepID=UPI00257F729A|nr:zinc ribbon domain-containing protein [Ralstonia sp.]MBA4232481.1 hypothetical protein [Ralstonia sp.]
MSNSNLFLDLDLPADTTDSTLFEAAVTRKVAEWSKQTEHPSKGPEVRVKLAAIHTFRETFRNESARAKAAAEARAERGRAENEVNQRLGDQIKILSVHGSYVLNDLDSLAKEFKDYFTADQIKGRLTIAGLLPASDNTVAVPAAKVLDSGRAKAIETGLKLVGVDDLYALVGLTPSAKTTNLRKAVDEQLEKWRHKIDPVTDERKKMLGEAGALFSSDEERSIYDATLANARLTPIGELIERAARGGFISIEVFNALMAEGVKRGASLEATRAFILSYAVKRKFKVQEAQPAQVREQLVCANCRVIHAMERTLTVCTNCGLSLFQQCPKCRKPSPVTERTCPTCKFAIGDAPDVEAILSRVERFIDDRKFRAATTALDEAKRYEADWPKVDEARAKIRKFTGEYEKLRALQDDLARSGKMVALQRSMTESGLGESPDYPEIAAATRKGADAVREADDRVAAGRQLLARGDSDGALDAFEAARAKVTDHEAAAVGSQQVPPPAVGAVDVEIKPLSIRVDWSKPVTKRVLTYRVVRKEGRPPATATDGTIVGETGNLWIEDSAAPKGVPLYYGVISCRSTARSTQICISKPILMPSEVSNVMARPGDRQIKLTWRNPQGAAAIVVTRTSEAPAGTGAAETVYQGLQEQFLDAELKNGARYAYSVCAAFQHPEKTGKEIQGPPARAFAVPAKPAAAILDLTTRAAGSDLILAWTLADPGATVSVFLSDMLSKSLPEGETRPAADLPGFLGRELGEHATEVPRRVNRPRSGRYRLTPVTIRGGVGTIGRSIELNLLDPVTELRVLRDGQDVTLTWRWPDGALRAIVRSSEEGPAPEIESRFGQRLEVDRLSGEAKASVRLRLAQGALTNISVFALYQGDSPAAPAKISTRMGGEARVSYSVKCRRRLWVAGPVTDVVLELSSDTDVTIPSLSIVLKRGGVPLHGKDGEVIEVIAAQYLSKNERLKFEINPRFWDAHNYVRLSISGGAEDAGILLQQPKPEQRRLG